MAIAEPSRPTPEQFLNLIRRQARGRLKVYLGSAAGVGKTYAMLREGQRLKKQGVDVVIGFVETHGRAETQEQIGDLEIIPPRIIEYRGVKLREMDLDAILARRPTVCLVDELAHTNVPGSKHAKRYQDVEELLHRGHSCDHNREHPALREPLRRDRAGHRREGQGALPRPRPGRSRPDRQRRRLGRRPDRTAQDRQDLPPGTDQHLARELLHPSNLTRLREITLTEIAHLIDRRNRRAEADQAPISATDRVMVGVSSRSPNAPALLRKTARIADRLNVPWYAVYIQTPSEDLTRIDAATQRFLSKNLELAQQLGGIPMTFRGPDVASTMWAFAQEYAIKVIVIGKSRQPWFRRLTRSSILDRLMTITHDVDVIVVDV